MYRRRFLVISPLILLAATFLRADVTLTIATQPEGATISNANFSLPSPVSWKISGKKGDCVPWGHFTVTWVSGASVTVDKLMVCQANGKKQTYTVTRPTGVAGAEVDARYAAQLQELELMRKQILLQAITENMSQPNSSLIALQELIAQRQADSAFRQRVRAMQDTLSCTSRVVGAFIHTDCGP